MKKLIATGCFVLVALVVACGYFVQNKPDSLLARAEPGRDPVFRYSYLNTGNFAIYYDEDTETVSVVDIIARPLFPRLHIGTRYLIRYHIRYNLRENKLALREIDAHASISERMNEEGVLHGAEITIPYIRIGTTNGYHYLKFGICAEKRDYDSVLYEMEQNGYYVFCVLQDERGFEAPLAS